MCKTLATFFIVESNLESVFSNSVPNSSSILIIKTYRISAHKKKFMQQLYITLLVHPIQRQYAWRRFLKMLLTHLSLPNGLLVAWLNIAVVKV